MLRYLWDWLIWKPRCEHEWELLTKATGYTMYDEVKHEQYQEFLYRCVKCCKRKSVKTS